VDQVIIVAIIAIAREVHRPRPNAQAIDEHKFIVHQALPSIAEHFNAGVLQLLDFDFIQVIALSHDPNLDPSVMRRQ